MRDCIEESFFFQSIVEIVPEIASTNDKARLRFKKRLRCREGCHLRFGTSYDLGKTALRSSKGYLRLWYKAAICNAIVLINLEKKRKIVLRALILGHLYR